MWNGTAPTSLPGLGNELIDGAPPVNGGHRIRCRQRLGGLLNY
jgi:hypothetical protein